MTVGCELNDNTKEICEIYKVYRIINCAKYFKYAPDKFTYRPKRVCI